MSSLFNKYQVSLPSKSNKPTRLKSPNTALFIEHEIYLYYFPMTAKYYAKNEKKLHSSLCDQTTTPPSISQILDFNYEKASEGLVIIRQDFVPEKKP